MTRGGTTMKPTPKATNETILSGTSVDTRVADFEPNSARSHANVAGAPPCREITALLLSADASSSWKT